MSLANAAKVSLEPPEPASHAISDRSIPEWTGRTKNTPTAHYYVSTLRSIVPDRDRWLQPQPGRRRTLRSPPAGNSDPHAIAHQPAAQTAPCPPAKNSHCELNQAQLSSWRWY